MQCATDVAGWMLDGISRGGGLTLGCGAAAVVGTAGGGDSTLGVGAGVGGGTILGGGITCGSGTTLGGGGEDGDRFSEVCGAPAKGIGIACDGVTVCAFQLLKSSHSLVIDVGCSLCSVDKVSFTAKDRKLRAQTIRSPSVKMGWVR